jgi:predicted AAA+ superfamily ATPase
MIKRIKINEIVDSLAFFPVVGIIGPRQVGKTTLAKQLEKVISKQMIYLDLENPRDLAKLQDPVLYFEDNIDKCIILDEIQNTPYLFPIIRSMVDLKREAARFIILGSASPDLIRDTSESLAGRIAYIELTPFNLIEVYQPNIQDSLWLKGGYPDAFLSPKIKFVEQWHYNYIKTYVERDLPNLGLTTDKHTLTKLFQMLSHFHGDLLNYNTLSKSLGLSVNTIKKYISFFENAFLIRLLQPFHTNIKKRLIKSPKVYVRDSGILHYLQNISEKEDLYGNPLIGNSWEGFVIEQIVELLPQKYQVYFYRTQNGAECDLVIAKSQKPLISLEIKYSSSPKLSKGGSISFNDLGAENNYIITPNSDDYLVKEDVRVCSLYRFLTKYLPK